MYHIGSPQCAEPGYQGAFFAYDVLSSESREHQRRRFFEIAPMFRDGFRRIVRTLLDASPVHSVFLHGLAVWSGTSFSRWRDFRVGFLAAT